MSTFYYSGQIRRFLQQFIRLLSNFQVQLGSDRTGTKTLLQVPVYYGDSSRQVASIIAKNTENNLPTVPAMTVYISGLKYDRPRVQEPHHVSKMFIRERSYDPETGEYGDFQGDVVTVERLMPVPYLLSLKVDIWTSNTDQKLQLIEQLAPLFNPSLEIQSSDSYVDWTSLSVVTLVDYNFSSRTVPVGAEDPIDVASLSFELPIWLSVPAKVKRQGVIHKIISSVYDPNMPITEDDYFDINGSLKSTQMIYTPINLNVVYLGNTLKLYQNSSEVEFIDDTEPALVDGNWRLAIASFGELAGANSSANILTNGISQVRLNNDGITVVGTVSYHPLDDSLLLFNAFPDTLPVNTLAPIDAIIDPHSIKITTNLLNPILGTRYMILSAIGSTVNDDNDPLTIDGPKLWNRIGHPELVANKYDIIEWDGFKWVVSFDSANETNVQYVTNLSTGIQYKWKNQEWFKSVIGRYGVGAWSFVPNW